MPRSIIRALVTAFIFIAGLSVLSADEPVHTMKAAQTYHIIPVKVLQKISIPKWYHEGLFCDGKNVWVSNGKDGKTWVIDPSDGSIVSEIGSIAGFTEAVTKFSDELFFATDWDEKKIYLAKLSGAKFDVKDEKTLAPAHPAGVLWNGSRLFVIAWTRGMGTKFDLLEMDKDLNILRKTRISRIQEPAHMAWDGKHMWVTSWYNKRVYKVDIDRMEVLGSFVSPADLPTGIAWDGRNMWLTGTYSDLYKLEINMEAAMDIKVTSSAFKDGGIIPKRNTCDGEELSPQLSWSGVPAAARSLALISDDPDAPAGTWVHWVLFNMPPETRSLPEGVGHDKVLPDKSRQGVNDSRKIGYDSPCPPSGTHRYYFKVYALDTMLDLAPGATKKDLLTAMEGHILAQGELIGKYKR